MQVVCKNCGKSARHKGLGLCYTCHAKRRYLQDKKDGKTYYALNTALVLQKQKKRWISDKDAVYKIRRKHFLKKNFGMTPEDYEIMLKKQNGCCALCGYKPRSTGKRLAVDHNHKEAGRESVRGLLCATCNFQVLPRFEANPEQFVRLIQAYLKQRPLDTIRSVQS